MRDRRFLHSFGMSDDDADRVIEEALRQIRDTASKLSSGNHESYYVLNPEGIMRMSECERILHDILTGYNVRITSDFTTRSRSSGYIRVIAEDIAVNDPPELFRLIRSADEFEIHPRTDGTVEMNFDFFDLSQTTNER